jgi:nitronate monooxygenase
LNPFKIGDLTIPVPIIQGGMGIGVSLSGMASSVANMGGIGVISSVGLGLIHGKSDKSYRKNNILGVEKEIRKARKLTSGILGINIMSVMTNYDDIIITAINEGIDIIFSGAGLPLSLPQHLNGSCRTKLVPIVSSARAASIITEKWQLNYNYLPDAFVVEGPKAGGHLGFSYNDLVNNPPSLDDLVLETLTVSNSILEKYNKNVPVIAAGGIVSGKDIYHFLNLGASAVQMGSRFIATKECDASMAFKEIIINSKIDSVRLIKSPVGMPGRAIENNFLKAVDKGERKPINCKFHCLKSCNPKTTSYCIAEALLAAYKGDFDNGFAFSGANAYEVNSLSTVADVFKDLISEYELTKSKLGK